MHMGCGCASSSHSSNNSLGYGCCTIGVELLRSSDGGDEFSWGDGVGDVDVRGVDQLVSSDGEVGAPYVVMNHSSSTLSCICSISYLKVLKPWVNITIFSS